MGKKKFEPNQGANQSYLFPSPIQKKIMKLRAETRGRWLHAREWENGDEILDNPYLNLFAALRIERKEELDDEDGDEHDEILHKVYLKLYADLYGKNELVDEESEAHNVTLPLQPTPQEKLQRLIENISASDMKRGGKVPKGQDYNLGLFFSKKIREVAPSLSDTKVLRKRLLDICSQELASFTRSLWEITEEYGLENNNGSFRTKEYTRIHVVVEQILEEALEQCKYYSPTPPEIVECSKF